MNILFCSVGRRGELVKDFKRSMSQSGKVVATDCSPYAPALYFADSSYIVPRVEDPSYISIILEICCKESIDAITTFIDPEIAVLSQHRKDFEAIGALPLLPYEETARLCFDKYEMYKHLVANGIPTVPTYGDIGSFEEALRGGKISFPVFVKPRCGSGSVGARRIDSIGALKTALADDPTLIIQELVVGEDVDADVYIDAISHELVSVFTKRKLSMTIGGANKTVSFKDGAFFEAISKAVKVLDLCGPSDIDFFIRDGRYLLSEVNPRFGGAYLHAYGAGVDFVKLIENNVSRKSNEPAIGHYDDGVVMMMYDSVVIKRADELDEKKH